MTKIYMYLVAQRDSRAAGLPKKHRGSTFILVATQKNRRTLRRGRDTYVYRLEGTQMIYYNHSKDGIVFYPIAYDQRTMEQYYDTFVGERDRPELSAWRHRNDYVLVDGQ